MLGFHSHGYSGPGEDEEFIYILVPIKQYNVLIDHTNCLLSWWTISSTMAEIFAFASFFFFSSLMQIQYLQQCLAYSVW